ncbi:hypothetical protein [Yanghanlia caeni]|uniref:Uncharacterized protein n=1 Tax=Yanghanlia caeni TaxID=3064283 RepID=A0ABU1D980_9BURK|nr:hypothetical protein [Alcaligenaceae bacterium LG-2]
MITLTGTFMPAMSGLGDSLSHAARTTMEIAAHSTEILRLNGKPRNGIDTPFFAGRHRPVHSWFDHCAPGARLRPGHVCQMHYAAKAASIKRKRPRFAHNQEGFSQGMLIAIGKRSDHQPAIRRPISEKERRMK